MHPNQTTLENFYTAFARLDADTMATCYASGPGYAWLAVGLDTFSAQQGQGDSGCKFAEVPRIA